MLMQVLSLTTEQINALPPGERDAIIALVGKSLIPFDMGAKRLLQRNQFRAGS
jgi:hypothetical protein